MSQLQYIRRCYNVPAFRGMRIRYTGGTEPIEGRIVFARGPHIGVKFDGREHPHTVSLHPTWKVEYLQDPAKSPPHAKGCAALRDDQTSQGCDCGFMDRFKSSPMEWGGFEDD